MSKLFLFDMDGTLTKGSILLDHAGFLIEKGYIHDDGSYKAWLLDRKNERLITNLARSYQAQISGMTVKDMHAKEFIEFELSNSDKWYSSLETLQNERDKGSEIWIISGSADYLVQELVKRLNVKGIGTKYHTNSEGKFNGKITPMFNEEAKIQFVQNNIELGNFSEIHAFGDTGSDSGLFCFSDYNTLVDPTSETLEYFLLKRNDIEIHNIIRK